MVNWLRKLILNHRLAAFVIFDFVWLSAVLGRENWIWLTVLLIVLMFAATPKQLWHRRKAFLIIVVAGLGAELLTVIGGVIQFTGTEWLPAWLILLWFGFAGMALMMFDWLRGRAWLAAILGGVFGPITYFAGTRIGAAELQVEPFIAAVVYVVMWALLMILVARLVTPIVNLPKNPKQRSKEGYNEV